MCGEHNLDIRRRRSISSTGFRGTKQFAVISTSNKFQNTAPVITSSSHVNRSEDLGLLDMYLTASDEEGDNVLFRLNKTYLNKLKGNVSLETSGRLRFSPCTDCFGDVTISFIAAENRFDGNQALSTEGILTIHITPVNDNPQLVFVSDGRNLIESTATGQAAHVTVEQNVKTNTAYRDLTVFIASFDVDQDETLKFNMEVPTNGTVRTHSLRNVTFIDQDCETSSRNRSNEWETLKVKILNGSIIDIRVPLPCNMTQPHPQDRLSWTIMMVVYRPHYSFYGTDTFKVFIFDFLTFVIANENHSLQKGIQKYPFLMCIDVAFHNL